ncbi:chemotaxis protein CheA [Fulvivirgaceae bacterium PWU4]|uniref:Chemotaxis protein CheA n=1 Tax=Chryseosolibacter histidini TaxID=2782349 RepID=A0AAP2DLG1_9BACT|nr:chemotaxis protein CheA [Chryseosolibacter histidini]MBT1698426.1 chemotaxis protein CheA [Chryseosolibacter histidini]
MDSNQKRFVEDALDLLNELDEGLLQLEANAHAKAPLEQVFRTMHTIKGGANMFGFDNIGELAHYLETLFDLVRQGKTQVSDKLISITLQAFDKVRDLLKEKTFEAITRKDALYDHLTAVHAFHRTIDASLTGADLVTPAGNLKKDELATFFVNVTPLISMTEDGNHPLVFIVQDIAALGTSSVKVTKKQSLEIAQWEIFLSTTTSQAELESYFIFVEDESRATFTRLAAGDLFEQPEFIQYLKSVEDKPVNLDELRSVAGLHDDEAKKKTQQIEEEAETQGKRKVLNDTYIKVSKRKIDDLLNWISELIILQAQFANTASKLNVASLTDTTEQLDMVTRQLRDTSLEIGLVPIETLVTKFKRLVRDLSKTLNKKVNFLSEGAETEIDKDVIELMTEPMIHIIRNAIDHGIESPADRKAASKAEHGTVKLRAFTASSYVNIIISDDGKGIDKERVLQKAKEKGLVDAEAQLSEDEILNLIFHPGLSTTAQVSDVSGRGVGMDVVKQKINELRGHLSLKSLPGRGTSIHIRLPLSRSIIEGLLVKIGVSDYIIPLAAVDKCYEVPSKSLTPDGCQKLLLDGQPVPVFYLQEIFRDQAAIPEVMQVIKINYDEHPVGITVDNIVGEYQTVLKPLGDMYQRQEEFSGATILGNGAVALVLDTDKLVKQLVRQQQASLM